MLTTLHQLLVKAEKKKFAIPAFNVTNLETALAVVRAAVKTKSPVIIQTSEAAIQYAGHQTLLRIMENVIAELSGTVPIVTHLDHGKHFETVKASVNLGYRSVHMDASEQPYDDNVSLTKKAVTLGHAKKITVQGELGYLLGYEGMMKMKSMKQMTPLLTDPEQAKDFAQKTGVDTLAVAVGTAHGMFRGKEKVDFQRLIAIKQLTGKPLVLHGGSGVYEADIRKAISFGIRIINIDTDLRLSFMSGLQTAMKSYDPTKKVDVREPLGAAALTMEKEAITMIRLLGSANQA